MVVVIRVYIHISRYFLVQDFLHLDVNIQITILYIEIAELPFAQSDSLCICLGRYVFAYQHFS